MSTNQTANQYLSEAPIIKLMIKFSIPCIVSLLISSLYNIVDQIFVGHGIGYLGNGATTVVYPLTVISVALSLMIGNGCAAYFSICQGRGDHETTHKTVGNAIILASASGIIITVLYAVFMEQILWLFGATTNNIAYAREYFRFILIGIPLYTIDNALNAIIRADGSPKYAMAATCTGCIINVILDPIAIFVLDWGMMGAAIATSVGQIVAGLMAVFYLFRTKSFRLKKSSFRPNVRLMGKILSLGLSSFFTQMMIVVVMAVMNNVLVKYGALSKFGEDIPMTVLGVAMRVFAIVTAITSGLAVGLQPITGYNYGANRMDRIRALFKNMLIAETVIGLIALFAFEVFPLEIISLFGTGDELYKEFAILAMRIYLCGVVMTALQRGCCLFMQALGKSFFSSLMSLIRELVHVPLMIVLPIWMGVTGVLYSAPISDVAAFLVTFILAFRIMKNLKMPEQI